MPKENDELVVYNTSQVVCCNRGLPVVRFHISEILVNISLKGTVIGRGILLKEEDGEIS